MKKIAIITALFLAGASSLSAQSADEVAAWGIAKNSTTSAEVFEFIETYPNGEFAKEAKALMIDLLWLELAANPVAETDEIRVIEPVTFSAPLAEGSEDIIGRSLEELIDSKPLFAPVEGLPEEYWSEQECASCHEWERSNLCVQAQSYLNEVGAENLVKQHPFGGTFKLNLQRWAENDCQ